MKNILSGKKTIIYSSIFWILSLCYSQNSFAFQDKTEDVLKTVTFQQLREDNRLQLKFSLTLTAISLEDLLKKVSTKQIHLISSKRSSQQKFQLNIKDRPLFVFMESLAQILQGEWSFDKKRNAYFLDYTSIIARQRETWWELFLAQRDAAIAEQKQHILRQMRKPPYYPKETDKLPQGITVENIASASREQEFYYVLPPSLQEKIANSMILYGFYRTGATYLGNFPQEGVVTTRLSTLPIKAQEILKSRIPNLETDEKQTHALYGLHDKSSLQPFLIVLIRNLHAVFPHRLQAM